MANEFYALLGRMRYITRWGLMRNTFSENIQEHSHQVAVLAHALALIRREILKLEGPDPDRCAVADFLGVLLQIVKSFVIPIAEQDGIGLLCQCVQLVFFGWRIFFALHYIGKVAGDDHNILLRPG